MSKPLLTEFGIYHRLERCGESSVLHFKSWPFFLVKLKMCRGDNLPWPPGYMHRKTFPNSSAWDLPDGVSSPPHLRIRSREGSFVASEGQTLLGLVFFAGATHFFIFCFFCVQCLAGGKYKIPHWIRTLLSLVTASTLRLVKDTWRAFSADTAPFKGPQPRLVHCFRNFVS